MFEESKAKKAWMRSDSEAGNQIELGDVQGYSTLARKLETPAQCGNRIEKFQNLKPSPIGIVRAAAPVFESRRKD